MTDKINFNNISMNSNINIIPKEKIKFCSKLYNQNSTQNLNDSFTSVIKEQKCLIIENISTFLNKKDLSNFIKVNFIYL